MKKKVSIIIVTFVLLGCSGDKSSIERPVITGVEIINIRYSKVNDYYKTSGTITAKTVSELTSRVTGEVLSIEAEEGDTVSKNQLLMEIDDRDIRQKVIAAEESLKVSKKAMDAANLNRKLLDSTYKRYRKLYEDKALTRQEMDEIETRKKIADTEYSRKQSAVERAGANLKELRINLGYTKIKSPVDGLVTDKKVEIGNTVYPGVPLLTVEDNSSYRLEVNIDEKLLGKFNTGTTVLIDINALGKRLQGRIADIVPSVDPLTRTFLVKIELKNNKLLKYGLFATASIPYNTREAILIPSGAIVQKGQLTGVYLVSDEGIVNYNLVRTGAEFPGGIEILSGLKKGNRIIVNGVEKARDGGIVESKKPI